MEFPKYKSRRIVSITTACLEWVDTRLVNAAIVARASPNGSKEIFKNNPDPSSQTFKKLKIIPKGFPWRMHLFVSRPTVFWTLKDLFRWFSVALNGLFD